MHRVTDIFKWKIVQMRDRQNRAFGNVEVETKILALKQPDSGGQPGVNCSYPQIYL